MRIAAGVLLLAIGVSSLAFAEETKTYVGVITDTMCTADHKPMKVTPDSKCVKDCVGEAKTFQYALLNGAKVYRLSDQATPARFAGQRVKVTGVLYTKTDVLKVERIEGTK